MFFESILLLFLIPRCFSQIPLNSRASQDPAIQKSESNATKSWKNDRPNVAIGFRIRSPFMDMDIQGDKNIFLVQEQIQRETLFLLHGNELFEMFVDRDEKRLSLIGFLGGKVEDMELLGAELISWREHFILVIALEDYLEVYQISKSLLERRAKITKDPKRRNETAPIFEPIQQILLTGRYRQHFLTDPDKEHILLIVGVNFTKLYGHLLTFVWSNSFFEPVEELTVPPMHALFTVGGNQKYLVRGRVIQHQTKTIITVHEIQSPSMKLRTVQTFTAHSRSIHVTSFRDENYLIACSTQQKQCNSFRMGSDGRFGSYKQRPSNDLAFDRFVGGRNFLVAARQNEVLVYTNGRLDCFASFSTTDTDVSSVLTLVNNHGENFVLLNYKRPFRTLVRFVELETEEGDFLVASGLNGSDAEDTNSLSRHRHMFEETIGKLRRLLLQRRSAMDTFKRISTEKKAQSLELELLHPVRIHAGSINRIRVVGQNLLSPLQMLQRIEAMRQRFAPRRGKRDSLGESILPTHLKVKHLKVKNLRYDGTVLDGFHLDNEAHPLPILSVRPKLTTKTLITNKLLTRQHLKTPFLQNLTLPEKKFKYLNVESVNSVNWSEFVESVFLKIRDTKVEGSLTLQAPTKITNLTAAVLNEKPVENLFNLEQPQVVHSNVHFSGFLIRELHAETVNGLDFANDIVYQSGDGLIESPVNMYHLSVMEDLLFPENVTIARQSNEGENEFKQFYGGRVVINGSLTVKNLKTEEAARIIVNRKVFSKDKLKEKYLLRSENQVFNSSVSFGNAKITVPSLHTEFLSGHPTEEHLLADEPRTAKQPVMLAFMNASIEGDLTSESSPTRIANISRNAVRRGDVANVTGIKTFTTPVNVEHLMTLSLNELPVTELVLKSQLNREFKFNGTKAFRSIWVEDATNVTKALNATYLNRLPIGELFSYDYHVDRLVVPFELQAENIVFHRINDICFDEVFNNFKLRDGQLVLHKELLIDGNVNFVEDLIAENINGIKWDEYQADLVRRNDDAVIAGRKCFLDELTITDRLRTTTLNEMNLEEIFDKILSISKPQIIEGVYEFENVQFSNVDVGSVNDVPTKEFIDTRERNVTIEGDISVPKITVSGDITTAEETDSLNLRGISEEIENLPNRLWRNIVVLQNAHWNKSSDGGEMQLELLDYLHRNAVQRNGEQIITGNVKFVHPLIKNMRIKRELTGELDFDFIAKDCVLRNSNETQRILAEKTFLQTVQMQNVEMESQLRTQLVNGIDILQLNSSLYRLSSNDPIIGPIHFETPPKIGRIFVDGLVNGMDPLKIYHNSSQPVPIISFTQFFVQEQLKIGDINDVSLDLLLAKRIPKHNLEPLEIAGSLSFEHLVLNENVLVHAINGIPIDKVVFKKSEKLQAITAAKHIEKNLILDGPVHVLRLNGDDLIESYQHSIFINRNHHYDKLSINGATFEKGLILRKMDQPLLGAVPDNTKHSELVERYKAIVSELNEIEEALSSRAKNFLYLDYAPNWNIVWQAPNVSVQRTLTFELNNSSLCERRFIDVQISQPNWGSEGTGTVFLSHSSTKLITKSAHEVSVKAENFCQQKNRKVKSKITITGSNFTRVFGMKKYTEDIIIYSPVNSSGTLILLHTIDMSRNRHEVRILKVLDSEEQKIMDWQSLTMGIGRTLSLFEFANFTALISGGGGLLNNHPVLVVYDFDEKTQKFTLSQSIDGDFDIHELLAIEAERDFQLILSCHQCQHVHIYSFHPDRKEAPYQIFQILKLKTLIGRVSSLKLTDSLIYLLFLAEEGQHYYYLYKFSPLQGWMQETYGYSENTKMAFPLSVDGSEFENRSLVALLCGVTDCSLVQAIVA